jgi:hypothetical protein
MMKTRKEGGPRGPLRERMEAMVAGLNWKTKHHLTGMKASIVPCLADVVVPATILSKGRWCGDARESLGAFVPELGVLDLAGDPSNR